MKRSIKLSILVAMAVSITSAEDASMALVENECRERPIVIIIPSYNNKLWCERNLNSVFSQEYANYRVIYIDDCSSDGTGDLVQQYIDTHQVHDKIKLVRNSARRGALANLYDAIHSCEDDEIVATLDGDDWLADTQVLAYLNNVYRAGDVWLTYGQFIEHPSGRRAWCKAHPAHVTSSGQFRGYEYNASHLRTFYAVLFKNILKEDLMHNGSFYRMTWDQAMMYPMLEMAQERHRFIDRTMYIYNMANALNDHKVDEALQRYLAVVIKRKRPYARLEQLERRPVGTVVYRNFVEASISSSPIIPFIDRHVTSHGVSNPQRVKSPSYGAQKAEISLDTYKKRFVERRRKKQSVSHRW